MHRASRVASLVAFLSIFLLAAGARAIRYYRWPGGCITPGAEKIEIARIAHSIASRGEFADPFPIATGSTGHHAPVYPFLLAGIYHYLPEHAWLPARAWLNIVLSSLVCAMAYLAGAALGLGRVPSFAVAVVLALLPARAAVEICNDQEAGLVAFMAASAVWASARFVPSGKWRAAWIGLIWGIALLSAPALVLVFACYLVWLGWQRGNRLRAAGIALVVTAVLLPWTLRNHARLGGWFFVRDSP